MTMMPWKRLLICSIRRKTGARGLRAIMENIMMDTMYHAPSDESIRTCRITKEVVEEGKEPLYNQDTVSESA